MAKIVDLDHKWALLIGRVFIAFGAIEKLTLDCLAEWLQDPIYDHLKNSRLSTRIDLVIELARTQNFNITNIENFIGLLKKAKKLAEKRNLIAHNPLLLNIFSVEPYVREIIQSNIKSEVYITFEELELITIECEELENLLIGAKVKFNLEDWPGLPTL